ncbi:MAG: GlmU family protein [Flavobacteriales bacterium]|nr:GlmU family protein [Flavobacteriales bacterium]
MHIILFEDRKWNEFLPLVFTRPVGDLRIGIEKISEKWSRALGGAIGHIARPYLKSVFTEVKVDKGLCINARLIPTPQIIASIRQLRNDEALFSKDDLLAVRFDRLMNLQHAIEQLPSVVKRIQCTGEVFLLEKITDIFTRNGEALQLDFAVITTGRNSTALHESNLVIGAHENLFVEEGAKIFASTLNTSDGPIYIGKNAEVMEGTHIRGPFSLGENSQLKMGTRIYGPTTIGPGCKVGGEVSNAVFYGFSNKAHDGFLGNALVGEWCNLGADTNSSNLKNNYSEVKMYNYAERKEKNTGHTFCGLIMADHTKCGINTMFNTGTVTGVCANIFGAGFPPGHVPSFSWGGASRLVEHDLYKAIETAQKMMARRKVTLTPDMRAILTEVYWLTTEDRSSFAT